MADKYTVTGQRPYTDPTETGGIARGVEITFATKPSNVVSSIRVPETQYNPTDVARLLDEAAATIETIHTL